MLFLYRFVSQMKKNLSIMFLCIVLQISCLNPLIAQFSGEWEKISELNRKSVPEKIELNSEADILLFEKGRLNLSNVYSIKFSNIDKLSKIADIVNSLPEIVEVYLSHCGNNLDDEIWKKIHFVDHLILEIQPEDTGVLHRAYQISHLKKVTFIFKETPKDWDFLLYYKQLPSIHVYGTMLPLDFYEMFEKLKFFHGLKELGVSIDFATDIPSNLNMLMSLKVLKLYDNLSRISNHNLAELHPERFNLSGILANDAPTLIRVYFYSEDFGLTQRENDYLTTMLMGKRTAYEPIQDFSEQVDKKTIDYFATPPVPVFNGVKGLKQPLESVKPKAEIFTIDTRKHNIIHTKNGFNVYIPANSLITSLNEVYQGKAQILFRQLSTPLDMFFMGLDMSMLKRPGTPNYSLGVGFEIDAVAGMQVLKIKENEIWRVEIPHKDTAAGFYFYDEESDKMLDYRLYRQMIENGKQAHVSYRFDEWMRNGNAERVFPLDNRSYLSRFGDPSNFFVFDEHNSIEKIYKHQGYYVKKENEWSVNPSKDFVKIKSGKALFRLIKENPKNQQKGDVFFTLNDKFDSKLFPEMKFLKRRLFKSAGSENSKEFSAQFRRGKYYVDYILETDSRDGKWRLILKSTEGYEEIIVEPGFYNKRGKLLKSNANTRVLNKFKSKITDKQEAFNQYLDQRKLEYTQFYDNRQAVFLKKGQFHTEFIRQTGLFGMLNVVPQENPIEFYINLSDDNGIPIDAKDIFVIDKKTGYSKRIAQGNQKLNPNLLSMIICVDFNGNIYYLKGDEITKHGFSDGSIYFLKLHYHPYPVRSVAEFQNQINYKRIP
jgi:hypothetical protein